MRNDDKMTIIDWGAPQVAGPPASSGKVSSFRLLSTPTMASSALRQGAFVVPVCRRKLLQSSPLPVMTRAIGDVVHEFAAPETAFEAHRACLPASATDSLATVGSP